MTDTSDTALELSDEELDQITASRLQIGDTGIGPITISSAIDPAGTDTLHLISGGSVTQRNRLNWPLLIWRLRLKTRSLSTRACQCVRHDCRGFRNG